MCTLAFCTFRSLWLKHEATPLHVMLVWLSLGVFCGSSFVLQDWAAQCSIAMGSLCLLCGLTCWRALGGGCWSSILWPQTCVSVAAVRLVCWRLTWHSTCWLKSCLLVRSWQGGRLLCLRWMAPFASGVPCRFGLVDFNDFVVLSPANWRLEIYRIITWEPRPVSLVLDNSTLDLFLICFWADYQC